LPPGAGVQRRRSLLWPPEGEVRGAAALARREDLPLPANRVNSGANPTSGGRMRISQSDLGTALGVTIEENRIDASNAEELKSAVEELVDAGHATLVIDMSQVEFIDSRGLGTCIALMKLLEKRGALGLCGLQPNVRGVFRLTRLDRVFRIFPDLAAAAAAPITPTPPRA